MTKRSKFEARLPEDTAWTLVESRIENFPIRINYEAAEKFAEDIYDEDPHYFSKDSEILVYVREVGLTQEVLFKVDIDYTPSFHAWPVGE